MKIKKKNIDYVVNLIMKVPFSYSSIYIPILFVLVGIFLGGMAVYDKPLPTDWSKVEIAIGKTVSIPIIATIKIGYQAGIYTYPYNQTIASFFVQLLPPTAIILAALLLLKVIFSCFKTSKAR